MTGFGSGSALVSEYGLRIEVDLSSVNRKTLDVYVNAPREWSGLEQSVNEWLKGGFSRGRVNVQIKVSAASGENNGLCVSEKAIDDSIAKLKAFAESRGIEFTVNSQLILDLAKMLKDNTGLPDWKEFEAGIQGAFMEALADINRMRECEGAALAKDLITRIDELDTLATTIEEASQQATTHYRDALLDRLKQLKLELDLSDERVLKEVALFADRSDISEELTRLKSHFEQFRGFIAASEPTGRKMDFLCQEIHREFNTTGSKSTQLEVTRAVIEGKNELERIREQVQNVE